ncbi:membrane protein [Virgibacillus soli]|nr:membrane protein [Virgibacillus soli]
MDAKEKLFWSIAFPGFGQLLNKKYVKGLVLIALEFVVNVKARFNDVIIASFHGDMDMAMEQVNFQWLLFYPCLYFFAMWDAYKDAGGGKEPYSFMPFVFCAYFVTVGTVYSSKITYLPGIIWFPMLCVIPGVIVGLFIKRICNYYAKKNDKG